MSSLLPLVVKAPTTGRAGVTDTHHGCQGLVCLFCVRGEMSCRCSELQRTVSPVPSAAPPQVLTKMVSFLQNSFPEALDRPVGFNFKQHGTLPRRLGTIRKETQAVQPRGSAATLRCIVETLALFSQVGGPRWGAGATKGLSAAHPRDDGCGLRYTVALEYNEHTQYVSVFTL